MGGREEGPVGSGCPIERVRWGAFSTGSWGSGDLHHGCGGQLVLEPHTR